MKEYIEREAAICFAKKAWDKGLNVTEYLEEVPAADVVPGRDFRDCRNELCLRCGEYKMRHKGACDGCRWRDA